MPRNETIGIGTPLMPPTGIYQRKTWNLPYLSTPSSAPDSIFYLKKSFVEIVTNVCGLRLLYLPTRPPANHFNPILFRTRGIRFFVAIISKFNSWFPFILCRASLPGPLSIRCNARTLEYSGLHFLEDSKVFNCSPVSFRRQDQGASPKTSKNASE